MDINDFLDNGVTVKNPNYKKPTKRNPSGSPRFIQSDDFNTSQDRSSRIGQQLSQDSYDLTSLDNTNNQYDTHNVRINPVNTEDELNQSRAKNQSAIEDVGRFATQAVGNEIVLGTALGLSNLVDVAASIGKKAGENDYTSPFSQYLEGKQDEIKKRFEIYRKDPNDSFAIGDFGWWADNAVSVASTLSLLIPSVGVERGLAYGARLGKLEKVSMGIAKAAKWAGATDGAATLAAAINSGAEIGTSALLSRTMENYQEARGTYKEVYNKSTERLKNMTVDDRAKLLKNNPDFVGKTDDEIAQKISGLSADETFKNDYAMLLMDMVQFKALGSMWKGLANKEESATLRLANKTAISGLVGDATETATKLGIKDKISERFQHLLQHPLTAIEAAQLSEGVEEGYQGIQQEKGKEIAEKIFDPTYENRDLSSYAKDGSIWEQAFWGALGGIAFGATGRALGNLSETVKGKYNKSRMTEQEYAVSQMTDEKVREQEINGRKARMQDYTDSMKLLNDNKNPYNFKLDPDTKQPILKDGSKLNDDLSKDESDQLKTKLTNDFVTNMTMDAIDKGNLDLFKEYISDPKFNQYFVDAGLQSNNGDKEFGQLVNDKVNHVEEQYHQSLYDILNSVDVTNENVAKIAARNIARTKLELNDLYNTSDDLSNQIATQADTSDYTQYEDDQRIKYTKDRISEIDAKESQLQKLLDNNQISPQAVEQSKKDNNIRRNQLLAFASGNNLFGNKEAVDRILKDSVYHANTNEFFAEFNRYQQEVEDKVDKPVTPKKSIQDLINKKITLDDHASYLQGTLPTNQKEYQSQYDDISMQVDRLTIDRYNKAADDVSKYVENHPNLDEAFNNIMTNNVSPELKDQLDILKLGHHSTQRFTSQINAVIKEVAKDRQQATEDAKNVTVDNITTNDDSANNEILDINNVADQTDDRDPVIDNSSTGEESQADTSISSDDINNNQQQNESINPDAKAIESVDVSDDIQQLDKTTNDIESQRAQDFILDNDSRAIGLASTITFNLYKESKNLFDKLDGKDVNSAEFNNIVNIVAEELFTQGVSRGYTQQAALNGVKLAFNTISRRLKSKGITGAEKFRTLADEVATKYKVEVNRPSPAPPNTQPAKVKTLKYKDINIGDKVLQGNKSGTITDKSKSNVTVTFDSGGQLTINNIDKGAVDLLPLNSETIATNLSQALGNINGNNQISNSTTKLIPNNEFNQVIDDFINSYVENKGVYTLKGSKTIINIEDLFKELLNNEEISFEQAKHIFYNITDYISASNNSKYVFTNKKGLTQNIKTPSIFFNNLISNKSTIETIDTYMHIAAPTKVEEGFIKAASKAINGGDIIVEGFGANSGSISIKSNGMEIGYLGTVNPNSTNTGYSLKNQTKGFVYNLNSNNGIIESNLDKLFVPLINKENQQYSELMDIAYKQFLFETAIKNNNISPEITLDDINKVLNNSAIKNIINNDEIRFPSYLTTNGQKARYILNSINNIVFYNSDAITSDSILESYNYWKVNTFNNYINTHKIQQGLTNNKKITTKLVNINQGKVLIDNTNHDINNIGFTYEQNPIMIVDVNGNIINERTNTSYSNIAGFEPGTMGMLVSDNPNAPIMALFTETNKLSTNSKLANQVYKELGNLLNSFQSKELSFDNLATSLSNLFSGPGIKSDNLFSGYNVIKTSDKIALNIQGKKGEYNLIIHKFEKGNNKEGTGITYIPNGDQSKAKSTINSNKSINNSIAKEIVSNLSFNKTFYAINNKNNDNEKSNQYLYKKNGKLIVNIGRESNEYDSFGHFVLANNAFKTNQGRNSDGGYFDVVDKVKSLYINTAITNSPVEESQVATTNQTTSDLIKSATKTESISTSQLLNKAGVAKDQVSVLTGNNAFNIELIPKETYFDNKATKAEAYYSNGKMFFTNKGANNINKSPANLVRLLIHENLHAKFEEQGLFQQANIVNNLMNTYYAMLGEINSDATTKEAETIRKWVADNSFTPTHYFSKLSVEQQKYWNGKSEDERTRQFAEEWLVESLTQPTIIRYLNNTIYNGKDINIEGIDNSAKTIWQKIIDVLLKLFSKDSGNIKNNTILAQQYSILGNSVATNIETISSNEEVSQSNNDKSNEDQTTLPNTNEVSNEEIKSAEAPTTFTRQRRERFATTSLIEDNTNTSDEVKLNTYDKDTNINMNGINVIPNMNDYINMFSEQDKPVIAKMMIANEIKFTCE